MATAREYEKTALVIGVLSSLEEQHDKLIEILQSHFGPIEAQSPILDFSFTDYYDSEMGSRPVRYLLLFKNLVDPSQLASFKTLTHELEKLFAFEHGNRRINLDPGILSLSNFILATCKDRSHRIPLRDGIYAETTLIYQAKDFQRLPWTYADYSSEDVKVILRGFRQWLKTELKKQK